MQQNPELKGLGGVINVDRPTSAVDLSHLSPEPIGISSIFVVGSPRSGTTALGNVLGANSQCVSGDESMFLLSLWQDYDELVLGNNRRRAAHLGSYTTPQKALKYVSEYVGHFYGDLLASKQGARYVVDHTPWNSHVFEFINLLFPQAVYAHIVRDESQVVDSMRRMREAGGEWGQDTDELRRRLRGHMVRVSRAIALKAPERYYEIPHEEFSDSPDRSLERLLGSLGLHWESAMLDAAKVRYAN